MPSTRIRNALALATVVALIAAAACSGSSGPAVEGSDAASDASGPANGEAGSGRPEASGGNGSSSGSPPILSDDGNVDSLCLSEPRPGDCASCCAGNHPVGAMTYLSSVARCVCASGTCGTPCAGTYCATNQMAPAAGSTCATCINTALGDGGSCAASVNAACQADPDCVAYRSGCVAHCP